MNEFKEKRHYISRIMIMMLIIVVGASSVVSTEVSAASKKKVVRRALLLSETSSIQILPDNAAAIKKMLQNQRFKGKKINVKVYNNKTKKQITKKIKSTFKKTTKNDISYLYLAAHGAKSGAIWLGKGGNTYFTPAELRKICDKYIKGKVVIIMSSCYSGNFVGDSFITQFTSAKSGKVSKKKAKAQAKKKYQIICSAANNEVSYTYGISWATEFWSKAGGWDPINNVYTGLMADANGDKKVTMNELYKYSGGEILNRCDEKITQGFDLHRQHVMVYPANSKFVVFGNY